jgi:hypothetical protein
MLAAGKRLASVLAAGVQYAGFACCSALRKEFRHVCPVCLSLAAVAPEVA